MQSQRAISDSVDLSESPLQTVANTAIVQDEVMCVSVVQAKRVSEEYSRAMEVATFTDTKASAEVFTETVNDNINATVNGTVNEAVDNTTPISSNVPNDIYDSKIPPILNMQIVFVFAERCGFLRWTVVIRRVTLKVPNLMACARVSNKAIRGWGNINVMANDKRKVIQTL